ncbi:MAG: TatD family hydrolase [Kiritimatiellae bacterium]|nr:TatD family hydrolase [Kiritimatiellia bacterium]
MMIDTHCHVDLYEAPCDVVRDAETRHVTTIAVTYLPSHFEMAQEHLRGQTFTRPALGLHPLAAKDHAREIPLFKTLCAGQDLIGEIGLDFSAAGKVPRSTQEASFAMLLDCIRDRPRFVTLHSRGAEDVVLAHLERSGIVNAVFHWFSGSRAQLLRVLDAGHLLSVNPAMIRTTKWHEFIRLVPHDAILTESDGPFVKQEGRPAQPTDIPAVIDWLAASWQMRHELVEEQVGMNCRRVPALQRLLSSVMT